MCLDVIACLEAYLGALKAILEPDRAPERKPIAPVQFKWPRLPRGTVRGRTGNSP